MEKSNTVRLVRYAKNHIQDLHSFQLPEDQSRFTTLPSEYENSDEGKHRIVILADDRPVGFFLLISSYRFEGYTTNQHAMLLTSFSINHKEQGKGRAKQALNKLKAFVQEEFPDCSEIVLSVNLKNTAARILYEKTGFQDTGRTIGGPAGEQCIMRFEV
ncbi:GNAT family N-acetyltransferase [Salinicoccus hispanicus]|uniref:GNAT family N-acetyltransferase n=1 Tax=Salinicoccus hispanicus TaxID=157225 RepID=A0A6N8TW26_9STAP|nr:GNAT family N-acetyltransferase [Salinicoccus hispanicus]MXQ50114.1 GNAT family N-acetyltransferase [Salinicoccus hispanicus]